MAPNKDRHGSETNGSAKPKKKAIDIFFELDEIELEMNEDVLVRPERSGAPANRPMGRKVNPREIPKGHADLGDVDRYTGPATDFNVRDPERLVGRVVKGRYRVIEFLGGDENGLAYLADDRIVADKKVLVRILLAAASDEIMASILSEERVSLSHLSHPNIARIVDSGQFTNGPHFLISEYIDALSVGDILTIHGQLDQMRTARIVRQAANALNEAHQEGILHRDIRPENIIVNVLEGEPEQTKLVNFGASTGEPNPRNIAYKAHEVLDGRISTIASDIHSLAVVAYQMLTGRVPFEGSSAREILRGQKAGLMLYPTVIRPELPVAIDKVFDKAFAFRAVDRYPRARDLGDALYGALSSFPAAVPIIPEQSVPVPRIEAEINETPVIAPAAITQTATPPAETFAPAKPVKPTIEKEVIPAWKIPSPETPPIKGSRSRIYVVIGAVALFAAIGGLWYYLVSDPTEKVLPVVTNTAIPVYTPAPSPTISTPQPRNIVQPPDTNLYQNNKQELKGDLLRNFVGFAIYYPKSWKVNSPKEGVGANVRGKFLDIRGETDDGRLKEQMLISYYPSNGTYNGDVGKFPELVNETNETLKKLLPDYQMISEGETRINRDWRAYEIRFQGGGTSPSGEKLTVWGRRLYMPAARPGTPNGFEITMLATSLAENVRSVEDVGTRGELAQILYSFEPSRDF